jgi:hypothetical protein
MKIVLIILVVAVVLVVVFALTKMKIVTGAKVKMVDIPAIFEKVRASGKDGSFATLAFCPPGTTSPDEAINVQFSVEGGRIGVDWVLLGPPNIRDKEKFVQLAGSLGYKVVEREMNNVKYLRVEDGNLPRLCEASIRDLYSIPSDAELELIPDGFTWP